MTVLTIVIDSENDQKVIDSIKATDGVLHAYEDEDKVSLMVAAKKQVKQEIIKRVLAGA